MNKLLTKIVGVALGATMAIGVGVAVANSDRGMVKTNAETATITLNWSDFGISGTTTQTNVSESTTGYGFVLSSATGANGISKSGNMKNTTAFPGNITKVNINGAHFSAETKGQATVYLGASSGAQTTSIGSFTTSDDYEYDASGSYKYLTIVLNNQRTMKFTSVVVTYTVATATSLEITGNNYLIDGGSSGTIVGTITNNNNYTITWSASPSIGVTFSPATSSSGANVSVSFDGVTTGTVPITITGTLNNTGTAITSTKSIYALEHAGTSADPFTPTDAMVFSHADYAAQSGGDWYVGGYVVGTYTTKGYYLDEDKTATSSPYKFEIYNSSGVPTVVDGKTITVGTSYIVAHGSMTYYGDGSQAEMTGASIVSVDNGNVPSVSITEGNQSIYMGDALTFHATTEHAGAATVTWSSSDTDVATIGSNTGVVTTVGGGTTTITATITVDANNYTDSVSLEVTVPLLRDGDLVLFYFDTDTDIYLTDINTSGSTHYGNRTDTKANAYVYTVSAGSAANSYAFEHNGSYLSWTSGNSLNYANSVTDNSSWSITGDSLTSCTIKNVADPTRIMKYNSGSPRFACYTSGQNAVCIEKVVISNPTTLTLDTKTLSLEAEEVSTALTFTTDSSGATFHWYSEDTTKATVTNGVVTAGTQTGTSVKIYVYFDTDGSGDFDPLEDLNDYCTVTITVPTIDYTTVTYGGTGVKVTSSNASTYLANGKKIVMTYDDTYVAGAFGSYMEATSSSVTFNADTVTIGDGTAQVSITVLELETAFGGFYLKTKDGKYLSNTSNNSSAGNFSKTDSATTVWSVSDSGIYDIDNEANATIMFNNTASPKRFKPYKSTFAGGSVAVYSFNEYVDEAETYAGNFLNAGLCGSNDNTKADATIWGQQRTAYLALSTGAQNVLKTATANADSTDSIQKCLAKYDRVIYLHYASESASYPDFMNRVSSGYVTPLQSSNGSMTTIIGDSSTASTVVIILSMISLTAVGGYFFMRKKKEQ